MMQKQKLRLIRGRNWRSLTGAVITLLAVCGLPHRQSCKDIFAITCLKTTAVLVVIAVYYAREIV